MSLQERDTGRALVLAPRPGDLSLLTKDGVGAYALPEVVVSSEATTTEIISAVEGLVGSRGAVLRMHTVAGSYNEEAKGPAFVVELEPSSMPAPEGMVFTSMSREAIERIEPASLRQVVGRWLDRQLSGPSPQQSSWCRPGWFSRASAWMSEEMSRVGRPMTQAPHIHFMWIRSVILRAESAGMSFYLKCSAQAFRTEAVISAALADMTPDRVAPVVAVEPDEGWLLMRDYGSQLLGSLPTAEWIHGLEEHGNLQRIWSDHRRQLSATGVPSRPLRALAAAVPGMINHPFTAPRLSDDERAAWQAATLGLVEACLRLDALGPPDSLVHGDLHPYNIVVDEGRYRIVDWSDAAMSHPFLDLATFLVMVDDLDERHQMRDAYLAGWSGTVAQEALTEAGELALVVGWLYQIESAQNQLVALDPEDANEMHAPDARWVRRALAVQSAGIDFIRPRPKQ